MKCAFVLLFLKYVKKNIQRMIFDSFYSIASILCSYMPCILEILVIAELIYFIVFDVFSVFIFMF